MDFTSDIGSDNGTGHSKHRLLDSSSSSSVLGDREVAPAGPLEPVSQGSSDPGMEMLSKDDRRQLKLQDTKERLLAERQRLLQEVERLKDELAQTPNAQEQTSASDEEESEAGQSDDIDGNAARTLVDLMALASKKSMFDSGAQTADEPTPSLIDGNSGLQTELTSKYDTLPLLNIDLRLRYISQMTYPYVSIAITKDTTVQDSQRSISADVTFNRNAAAPICLTFNTEYNTSDETLQRFTVSDISPAGLNLTLRSFLQRHSGNPTAVLFCLSEYDRLLWARENLLNSLRSKYGSWEQAPQVPDHYTDVERRLVLRSKAAHTLAVTVQVAVPPQESIPRTAISMTLDNTPEATPDINTVFYGLVREYGVVAAALHVTQTVLFP